MQESLDLEAVIAALNRSTGFELRGYRRSDVLRALVALESDGTGLEIENPAVFDRLVRELTVGETMFFRHPDHFRILEDAVRRAPSKTLHIWSAGCATGEEPYSIAIALQRALADIDQWSITVEATDINAASLECAAKGEYPEWSFRGTPDFVREQWLEKSGSSWIVPEELKRLVRFERHNLATDSYPESCDAIFCRNVLIYFDEASRRSVVERLAAALKDGGLLFVGHSDLGIEQLAPLDPVEGADSFVYRKRNASAVAAPVVTRPPARPATLRVRPDRVRECPGEPLRNARLPEARFFLRTATQHIERDEDELAADALRKSIYLDPNQPAAHYFAGCIELRRGGLRTAAKHFRAASRLLESAGHPSHAADSDLIRLLLKLAIERELERGDEHE